MKRTLGALTLTATLLTACASDEPTQPGTGTTVPVTTMAPATTTAAEPVTSRPAAPPTTAPPTSTPASPAWRTCSSTAQGYSIGYPATWHTDTPGRSACVYFDPEPVEYIPNSDGFLFALMVGGDNRSFEDARRPVRGPDSRTLIHEEITVGGRRAVRYEVEVVRSPSGYHPDRSRFYGYLVEREGIAFGVSTYWFPDQPLAQYQAWKDTVDRAVTTLRFL